MLTLPVTFQRMKPVAWWIPQVIQFRCKIHVLEFACCSLRNIWGKLLGFARLVERLRTSISERLDHAA